MCLLDTTKIVLIRVSQTLFPYLAKNNQYGGSERDEMCCTNHNYDK